MFAVPVTAATGVVGAGVIFGALALLGVLLALGLSIRSVAAAAGTGARRAVKLARAGLGIDAIGTGAEPEAELEPLLEDVPEIEPEPDPEPEHEPIPVVAHEEHVEIALPTVMEPGGQMVIDLGDDARARR